MVIYSTLSHLFCERYLLNHFADIVEVAVAAIEDIRGLTVAPLNKHMTKKAAKHVLEDNITIHDAYHLATALHLMASYFVTRDRDMAKRIRKYIRAASPEEIFTARRPVI